MSQNENKMGKRGQRQGPVEDEMGEGGDGESKIMTSLLLSMIERQDFAYLQYIYQQQRIIHQIIPQ